MARLLISPTQKFRSWVFEFCEDVIVTDRYSTLASIMPKKLNHWMDEFEYYYFSEGRPIAELLLDKLNAALRQYGMPEIRPVETTVYEHARNRDFKERGRVRQRIREDLETMKPAQRKAYVQEQERAVLALPPPHYTAAEHDANRRAQKQATEQSRTEVRARLALAEHQAKASAKSAFEPDTAAALLEATDDENLRSQIIGQLDKSCKLAMLKTITDQAVKNQIVRSMLAN